jgi:hypothetical protein
VPARDLTLLSDAELQTHAENLRVRVDAIGVRIQAVPTLRSRNLKVLRATFLTAGGFFVATFDPLGGLLLLIGAWDWVESISDDAAVMNAENQLRREEDEIEKDLDKVEAELVARLKR